MLARRGTRATRTWRSRRGRGAYERHADHTEEGHDRTRQVALVEGAHGHERRPRDHRFQAAGVGQNRHLRIDLVVSELIVVSIGHLVL
jgi:hypothetical protein